MAEAAVAVRTDEGLLAQFLGLGEVLLPLKDGKRLVDERQNVHGNGFGLLLEIDSLVEQVDGLGKAVLVEQQLAVVVVAFGYQREVLNAPPEGGHGRGDGAHLVLRHAQLDVRKDEGLVEVDRLLIVLGRVGKLALDKVQLRAVVVDVGIAVVVL